MSDNAMDPSGSSTPSAEEPFTSSAEAASTHRGNRNVSLFLAQAEMAYSEQAALRGVLSALEPQVSLELGTFRGGSLAHIAAHSREVHTFDLVSHAANAIPNVHYHLGETDSTVPQVLQELSDAQRTVDFVLVDADHSRAGVERDMRNLLHSSAVEGTVILLHDCANEGVREGARNAILDAPDIAYADLSFVTPASPTPLFAEAWGGLGIVVVDRTGELWQLERQVLDNVHWRTSSRRSAAWNALAPVRAWRRELLYRVRPMYRRIKGSRGVRLG
jgi:predicted O-methyltransferase YrrM